MKVNGARRRLALFVALGAALAAGATPTASAAPGTPAFAPYAGYGAGPGPFSVATGMIDGNTSPDLAVATSGGTVNVLLNNGNGTFGAGTAFPAGVRPRQVEIADVDADGRADLLAADYDTGAVVVLLGNGAGSFGAQASFDVGSGPFSLSVVDVTGDGRPDAVAASSVDNTLVVLRNAGAGSFVPSGAYPVGTEPIALATGDLDGDGDLDAATANRSPDTVSVLLNNGNGTFGARTDLPTAVNPFDVTIGDVDADGRRDLVVANFSQNTVTVMRGLGTGGFAPGVDHATGPAPTHVALADVDSDGRVDLVVANQQGNTVGVLRGTGGGTLAAMQQFPTAGGARWVTAADLDADGRVDLATADQFADQVSVLLNATTRNRAPVAADDTYAVSAGPPPPNVLANDVDPDGDPMTAVLVSPPAKGTVALNPNGTFSYTPASGATGTDSFRYAASDGFGQSAPATVAVTITPPNRAPVAANDRYVLLLGLFGLTVHAPGVLANDTDADGNRLTASLVSGPRHGRLTFNADGSFNYRPDFLFIGHDTFTYVARDGAAASAPATVSITVLLPSIIGWRYC